VVDTATSIPDVIMLNFNLKRYGFMEKQVFISKDAKYKGE
jgi:hypothetical protein